MKIDLQNLKNDLANLKFDKSKRSFYIKAAVVLLLVTELTFSLYSRTTITPAELAEDGDKIAQYNLGLMYAQGKDDVEPDYAEAIKWYTKSAEQGYLPAQFNLGEIYNNDEAVDRKPAEAVKWWKLAAAQGMPQAEYNLGVMYDTGDGVDRNPSEAMRLWRKAAEQGHPDAQYNVGKFYENGDDFNNKDYVTAYMWMYLSAEKKNVDAIQELEWLEGKMTPERTAEGKREAQAWKERHPHKQKK